MTVTDQIKILDRKIKQNESQYDLDREGNWWRFRFRTKYYWTSKIEYSPLDKIFNKGLSEDDKKEGLFKRLENIKDKNDELLNTINTTNKASKNKKLPKVMYWSIIQTIVL